MAFGLGCAIGCLKAYPARGNGRERPDQGLACRFTVLKVLGGLYLIYMVGMR